MAPPQHKPHAAVVPRYTPAVYRRRLHQLTLALYLAALVGVVGMVIGPALNDHAIAAEKLRLVEKVIQGRDFTAMPETINAVDAWLGSLPGHAYANVRQPPVSTLNLAHMIPLSAVWAGPERDEHVGAPPLLYGKTEGSTPFRFSLHVGDVGHTLVVGPTGAGKSVLLALMALQFRRYENAQVFAFDFGGSIRAAALAMGGDWHDLGGGLTKGSDASVSLQPLARIQDTYERAWAADWIVAILMREGIPITPEVKEHIWTALTSLASAPVEERTITGLAVLLQSNDIKQALRPYCVGGAYGRLLDAEAEHLGRAAGQQNLGKAAGRCPDIQRHPALHDHPAGRPGCHQPGAHRLLRHLRQHLFRRDPTLRAGSPLRRHPGCRRINLRRLRCHRHRRRLPSPSPARLGGHLTGHRLGRGHDLPPALGGPCAGP